MALFAFSYVDKPNSLALRMATREAHLAYANDPDNPVKVKLGGPYLDAEGEMAGSLIIAEAADMDAAQAFSNNDPYVKAGLFQSVEIHPFRITVSRF
jgi:uncharacterized protein